jgi:outer membrane protein assembly factor BamB
MRLLLGVLVLGLGMLHAADWPRFRGHNGSGVAQTRGLPAKFGPYQNVIWKVDLPPGHSSPVLSEDRIFLTAFEGDKLLTLCLDRSSGKVLWRREAPRDRVEKLDKRNSPASPSPVTDGQDVYVFFNDFGLLSYTADGKERWRTPLGPFNNVYGMGASPILADDKVVLVCDQGTNSYVLAVGKKDGRKRWQTARPEAISGHSTPVLYRPPRGPAVVLAPASFQLTAYSANTGEKMWWVRGLPAEMKSGPVLHGDTVFINGFNTPDNEPGRQVKIEPFAEALARLDANKDGLITAPEAVPDRRLKEYFIYLDLDRDGALDAREWEIFRASMASENGLLAIRMSGSGDITASAVRWKYQRAVPQLPTTLLYQNVLYMINDGGVLSTFDPETGAVLKQGRLRGAVDSYYASPVAGDGKVYFASRSGIVSVLKAGPEQEMLSVNDLEDEIYATPALADGRIYLRTRKTLYCFGQK